MQTTRLWTAGVFSTTRICWASRPRKPNGTIALAAPRIATRNTHGTGCSLSSAIAAGLAKGEDMETAVRSAKAWVSAAIAAADRFSVGRGHGPIHHFHKFY